MRLTMQQRQAVVKKTALRYQLARRRKEKRAILEEFVKLTDYHRTYAAFLLKNHGRRLQGRNWRVRLVAGKTLPRGKRPKVYGVEVVAALTKIWHLLDGICGKPLATALKNVLPILEKHHEIDLSPDTRRRLFTISPATIDRLLVHERKQLQVKGRPLTKPGTLLKHQIPIRTFSEWDEKKPGFLEMDLVGHEGGNSSGEFCQTLDATDVHTGWTETQAVRNKAQRWVFEAIQIIRTRLPFSLRGIDSDTGSEFINVPLYEYCKENKITFTRGRSGKKNDNCYVEQKNYSIVRRTVGYFRYDTEEELVLLNTIYQWLRLYTNYFLPTLKLEKKTRVGSKVTKHYEKPKTPYQRVLDSPDVPKGYKNKLKRTYAKLNPAHLKRGLMQLQNTLFDLSKKKREGALSRI